MKKQTQGKKIIDTRHFDPADITSQDGLNKSLLAVCDTFCFAGISAEIYKDFVLVLFFLKYISDLWQDNHDSYTKKYGDETELIEEMMKSERFVLPKEASFYALYRRRHEPGNGARIDQALYAIEEANSSRLKEKGKNLFQNISFNTERLGEEKQKNTILRHALEDFAKPELNLRPSCVGNPDIIGKAYEYLIKNFVASEKKMEVFYTPPEVSDLIVELLDPQPGDTICDPVCGSASLLLKCAKKIRDNHNSKKYQLYGQEAMASTWALAKINMFLHGEDNHKIEWGNTLCNPKLVDKKGNLKLFDVVVANPPFNLDEWDHDYVAYDKFSRFKRGLPPKGKSDYAFISHMIEILNPTGGVMGAVVSHGVLFRGNTEGEIRKKLIEENLLDAVIGLPEKLFYGTGIPTAILIFKHGKETQDVMFIDASREFNKGKKQNHLTQENIQKIVETYREGQDIAKYAYVATLDEIREKDYTLSIACYVKSFEEEGCIDLVSVGREREKLRKQLSDIEMEIDRYLENLGMTGI